MRFLGCSRKAADDIGDDLDFMVELINDRPPLWSGVPELKGLVLIEQGKESCRTITLIGGRLRLLSSRSILPPYLYGSGGDGGLAESIVV